MKLIKWIFLFIITTSVSTAETLPPGDDPSLFRWSDSPVKTLNKLEKGEDDMDRAFANPELMLHHELNAPIAPTVLEKKRKLKLSLREAVMLALRYNPNVVNQEIDRIVQRYNLRAAEYEFEWQYSFAGRLFYQDSRVLGINQLPTSNLLLSPNAKIKTALGGTITAELPMFSDFNTFNPLARITATQPLLRGSGSDIALIPLRNAFDREELDKLALKKQVITTITNVIKAYRSLISANQNVLIQLNAMQAAEKTIKDNEAKIKAGQLESTANVQQQAQVEQVRFTYLQNLIAQETAALTLLSTIGLDPDINVIVPDDVQVAKKLKVPDLQKTLDRALKNNIDYVSSLLSFKGLKRQLLLQIDNQQWDLRATAVAQVGNNSGAAPDAGFGNLFNGRNRLESIALDLTVPINDVPRKQLLINARLTLEKAKVSLSAAQRLLIANIINNLNSLKTQIKQIEVAELTVALGKRSYEIQLKKQQAGLSDSILVTQAQNQYITNQSSLISAKIAYLNTVADLQALLATTLDEWNIKLRYG